jgi:hypothetical protein
MRALSACIAVVSFLMAAAWASAEAPYQVEWMRQVGTSGPDLSYGIVTDPWGNALITGCTDGDLDALNAGGSDAFAAKYDAGGNAIWIRQLGTNNVDRGWRIATDVAGNAFITGYTYGALGGSHAGGDDAFVAKYDIAGNLAWTRQLGTSTSDGGYDAATDGTGNVFITGYTNGSLGSPNAGSWDGFVAKYDGTGHLAWTRQFGRVSSDISRSIATDSGGNVFVYGSTEGALGGANAGGSDGFVAKYDTAGNMAWIRHFGTSSEETCRGIATDLSGNVFITGSTSGALAGASAGGSDAFVAKYNAAGDLLWARQLGTSEDDNSWGITTDSEGNAFITGASDGALGGANAGGTDAFVAKYDTAGDLLWTYQIGTSSDDLGRNIAADLTGAVYFTGYTYGAIGGPNAGQADAFIIKLVVPEPGTLALVVFAGLRMGWRREAGVIAHWVH